MPGVPLLAQRECLTMPSIVSPVVAIAVVVFCLGPGFVAGATDAVPEHEALAAEVLEESGSRTETPYRTSPQVRMPLEGSERFVEMITGLGEAEGVLDEDAGVSPAIEPVYISVRAAVDRALELNPIVGGADEEVIQAETLIGQARSAALPQVSGTYALTRNERASFGGGGGGMNAMSGASALGSAAAGGLGSGGGGLGGLGGLGGGGGLKQLGGGLPIGGGLGSGGAALGLISRVAQSYLQQRAIADALPDKNIFTTGLTVRQVIDAGGEIRAGVRAAEALAEAQRWQRWGALDALEFDVKEAYYDLLLTKALVRVAEDSVATFTRNLADAKQMFEVGIMSNFEVLRAETELGAREADLVSARNAERVAEARFRQLIGFDAALPIEVDAEMDWVPLVAPPEELIALAHDARPEILALELAIEAAQEDAVRVRAAYKPRVAASAEYLAFDGAGSTVSDGWVFTVGAQWELFAGGRRRQERLEKQAEIRRLEYRMQELKDAVGLQVRAYRIQLDDAMANTIAREKTVTLAREGLRLAELRFEEGVGTQSEILDAELALTNAETSLIQALRDFAVSNAGIELAIGKSWARDYDGTRRFANGVAPILPATPASDGQ